MKRLPVDSSTIHSVGYDPDTRVLELEFVTGKVYEYFNVPEEIHQDLLQAPSHGQYFNANIRNSYDYEKVD